MLDLSDDWVWDFWTADDGERHHAFFLHAPRSLGDPELRHQHASVGHAVSDDLVHWERLPDVLVPGSRGRFDDQAIWTGCVVRDDEGRWRMFYSALSHADEGPAQRIGLATSSDLLTWERSSTDAWPLEPDPRWYAAHTAPLPGGPPGVAHWRDPFVVRDGAGTWHMYVTAQAADTGPGDGCVAHAVSTDLDSWCVTAPLGPPDGRFDQLEVVSVAEVDGQWLMVFSCLAADMSGARPGSGGTWVLPVDGPGSPVDLDRAVRLTDERLYVARLVRHRSGSWCLMAFRHQDRAGRFVGGVIDPVPVRWDPSAGLLKGFSKHAGVLLPID